MSEGAIEPTAVYPPPGAGQRFYQTYNTRYVSSPSPPPSAPRSFDYSNSRIYGLMQRAPGGSQPVNVQKPFPKFLGSRALILLSWVAAMIMVSLDEWHTYHILPRPARLWYTTLTYGLLAVVSTIEIAVPLTTMLAIGFTIAVAYQYYTGTGQFGTFGGRESGALKKPGTGDTNV